MVYKFNCTVPGFDVIATMLVSNGRSCSTCRSINDRFSPQVKTVELTVRKVHLLSATIIVLCRCVAD